MTNRTPFKITCYDEDDNESEVELPGKLVVCGRCDGRGSTVNPAIDGNGLSREDFAEDPDFAEEYRAGVYDISCPKCHGERVECVVDQERLTSEQRFVWNCWVTDKRAEREDAAEARRTHFHESGY